MTVSVPNSLDEALSPEWLTAALGLRFPGIEVLSVTPGPVVDRISTNARFAIEYAGVSAGPPPSLCVKGYFNEFGWIARHIGEPEAYFYRDLAEPAGVRTLCSVYADIDSETRHGVVITADVVAEGGVFLDGRSSYTPEQTAASLSELATLHAATWMQPRWATTPWLESRMGVAMQVWGEPATVAKIGANHHGSNGRGVPVELRDPQRLVDVYKAMGPALAAAESTSSWCVIHGDAHLGNLFLDAAETALPARLAAGATRNVVHRRGLSHRLHTHCRRSPKSERELLRLYLDRLAELGVEPPPWDDAWRALSRGIVHGFFLWSITTQVEPGLIEILLHRMGTAAADHDALTRAISAFE